MMNKQIFTRILFVVLACFTVQCEPEKEQEFPSYFDFKINGKSYTHDFSSIDASRQIGSPELGSAVLISTWFKKDSLIIYRRIVSTEIYGLNDWVVDQVRHIDSAPLRTGDFRFYVSELDDDARISLYTPAEKKSNLILTEIDTINNIVTGRFEGLLKIQENYKTGPLRRFRQFPDSFEVKEGRFRVKYEDFINK